MSSFGHPQGFNLKIATCFTKVSILVLKGTVQEEEKIYGHWFINSQE